MQQAASISVVLPVHRGVAPDFFRRSLESLAAQTRLPTEVVVVCDGPLLSGHRLALDEVRTALRLVEVRLARSLGAGPAIQAGLEAASGVWIARMDSDDIALPTRLETQMRVAEEGGFDLVGSAMSEFEGSEANIIGLRRLPGTPEAISRYVRMNNPINHPTAFFRRELAISVGGYRELPFLEDYDFFARMLAHGGRATNLSEPLLLFRGGVEAHRRRKAKGIFRTERILQRNLTEYGLVSRRRSWVNLVVRTTYRSLPVFLMRQVNSVLFKHGSGS